VVHRRHPEQHRRAFGQLPCHTGRFEPAQVTDRSAATQRAEDPEDQAVHVEEGEAVHEYVVTGPRPGVRKSVQGGGDGPAGDDGALGRAGGAGGVDDQGGGFGGGFLRYVRYGGEVFRHLARPSGAYVDVYAPQLAQR
jgi:hypothetical protein